ncbi:MAG TPA: hypothetical protein VGA53_04320 [Candidatus Paceibacterota bacterium]
MAQFETPQFIDREAKVIGPLTFKRAAYLGIPLAVIFALYFVMAADNFILFVAISILLEGGGVALAFIKLEGKSIPEMIMNALFFLVRPKTFVWKRGNTKLTYKKEEYINPYTGPEGLPKDQLTQKSRMADLSLRVQTKK